MEIWVRDKGSIPVETCPPPFFWQWPAFPSIPNSSHCQFPIDSPISVSLLSLPFPILFICHSLSHVFVRVFSHYSFPLFCVFCTVSPLYYVNLSVSSFTSEEVLRISVIQ